MGRFFVHPEEVQDLVRAYNAFLRAVRAGHLQRSDAHGIRFFAMRDAAVHASRSTRAASARRSPSRLLTWMVLNPDKVSLTSRNDAAGATDYADALRAFTTGRVTA